MLTTGEWSLWAADPGPSDVTLPLWLVIAVAIATPVLAGLGAVLGYKAAIKQTTSTAKTAEAQQTLERNQGYTELILKGADLARSPERVSREQGFAILDGVAQMPGLSKDNFELVKKLTRDVLEGRDWKRQGWLRNAKASVRRSGSVSATAAKSRGGELHGMDRSH